MDAEETAQSDTPEAQEQEKQPTNAPRCAGGGLTFSQALHLVRNAGTRLSRGAWNMPGRDNVWIEIQTRDTHSKMTIPYLYRVDNSKQVQILSPWVPNAEDLFTPDWYTVR